jgi:type IV pilus assembly protein PilQ
MRTIALVLGLIAAGCGGSPKPDIYGPVEPDLDTAGPPPPPTAAQPLPWTDPDARAAGGLQPERPTIYRGRKIDLDFKEVDLADVFRLLADVGGVNIVIADDVKGKVTLRLRRVPWDQALATVVKVKRLELEQDGSVYLVRKP